MEDKEILKSLSLSAILQMSPPMVQKVLIERILQTNEIKFDTKTLDNYEEYWKKVILNYNRNFLGR